MEEKTTKELWEDIERKNLEDALNAEPGSEEGKQAFKQATDAHNIREKENQIEDGKKESKRKIAVDILKGVVFGIAAFGGQVILMFRFGIINSILWTKSLILKCG